MKISLYMVFFMIKMLKRNLKKLEIFIRCKNICKDLDCFMACGKELLNKVDPEYLNVLLPRLSFGLGE